MKWILILIISQFIPNGICECVGDDRNIFLWTVEHPQKGVKGYLFGTIHVPYTEVWDKISDRVKEAFQQSDSIIFEIDLHDFNTVRKLIKCKNLKKKQTARSYLSPELYNRIEKYMNTFRRSLLRWADQQSHFSNDALDKVDQIYQGVAAGWDRKRPEWLLFVLYQLCENLLEKQNSPMLDAFLAQKAQDENKAIRAIESPEEQCNPVTSLSREQIVFAINYTLTYLEHQAETKKMFFSAKEKRSSHDLVRSYRCGSLEENIFKTTNHSSRGFVITERDKRIAREIDAILKEDILEKRNERMARRLHMIMDNEPDTNFFTAIGTGHFLGNNSVLEHLTSRGYLVNQVKEHDILLPVHKPKDKPFNSLWVRDRIQDDESIEVTIEIVTKSATCLPAVSLVIKILLFLITSH